MSWADADQEVAEPQVNRLCAETQECIIEGRWLDLDLVMLTSAELIFSKASTKALNLVINGKVAEHILPSFKKIDSFLREWNLGVKDQRELFLKTSNILKEPMALQKSLSSFL